MIPTYRRTDVVVRAIRSVLSQTITDLEVIVVDDEPCHAVARLCRDMDDPRIRYIAHEVNRGLSAARNTGIAAARAPYIAFLDDDDEWAPTKLERQLDAMRVHERDVVVTSYERWLRPDGSASDHAVHLTGNVRGRLLRDDMVHMVTLLVPTIAFSKVGGFDEQLFHHEDLDMALRLSAHYDLVTVPEPLTVIHVTPGSLSRNNQNRIRALERIINGHAELRNSRRLRSRWLYRLARLHAQDGDRNAWRRHLVDALRLDPTNVRAGVMLITGSVAGPGVHHQLARVRNRVTRRIRALRAGAPR